MSNYRFARIIDCQMFWNYVTRYLHSKGDIGTSLFNTISALIVPIPEDC